MAVIHSRFVEPASIHVATGSYIRHDQNNNASRRLATTYQYRTAAIQGNILLFLSIWLTRMNVKYRSTTDHETSSGTKILCPLLSVFRISFCINDPVFMSPPLYTWPTSSLSPKWPAISLNSIASIQNKIWGVDCLECVSIQNNHDLAIILGTYFRRKQLIASSPNATCTGSIEEYLVFLPPQMSRDPMNIGFTNATMTVTQTSWMGVSSPYM